jgi:hypothetical protein
MEKIAKDQEGLGAQPDGPLVKPRETQGPPEPG